MRHMAFGVLAGLFGTLFHPAANALGPAHYPKSPGMDALVLGNHLLLKDEQPEMAGAKEHLAQFALD